MGQALKTIADYIRYAYSRMNAADVFFGHGFDNAWDESVYLVLQSLHLPWDFDSELWGCRVTKNEQQFLLERIEKRIEERTPTAYLTRCAWFSGLPFYVDERVLVPRSPIGELIQQAYRPWLQHEPQKILDVCTGSGCIGIASALAFGDVDVDLLDISQEALEVAQINVRKHALEDSVRIIQSDVMDELTLGEHGPYDLIVSNPPYVDARDLAEMPVEFSKEPVLGLAAGPDGLDIVKRILQSAESFLSPQGCLIVELGNSWEALEAYYPDVPFTWIEFEHGGHGVFVMTADELKRYKW